ncbi:hemagglutinin/amebocyte aggregation factor-like [Ostrea edulis]|uniref:hemagglutinin/amebocyte aggregation factor-like n=1 Tax=Ostrea edulis TaxID=37623 RepID=UPI0024AEE5D4|nr:hemagglutinin/amebocyte aggregation factor-like [Ostrea edulis]
MYNDRSAGHTLHMHIFYGLWVALHIHAAFTLKNNWYRTLNFHCAPRTQAIDAIVSVYQNGHEDRIYEFHCGRVLNIGRGVTCHWSGYVNDFDQAVYYQCPGASYINGIASSNHTVHNDRRHSFRCCGHRGSHYHYKRCYWTNWLKNYDQTVAFFVPRGFVLRGVNNFRSNHNKGRRFRFEVCKLK